MTDANELQAQIAALAGRINRHKNSEVAHAPYNGYGRTSRDTSVVGKILKQQDYEAGHNYTAPHWSYQRGTPYGAPRGRGYPPKAAPHRHRTLVINNTPGQIGQTSGTPSTTTGEVGTGTSSGWVSKRDKSTMQLINNSVYEQKTQQRAQAIAKTREEQQKAKLAKLEKHFNTLAGYSRPTTTAPTTASPQVYVEDICFLVADGGSKLIKVKGETFSQDCSTTYSISIDDVNNMKTTPKQVKIAGVVFLRSKHGNLYRAGMIKTLRSVWLNNGQGVKRRTLITTFTVAMTPKRYSNLVRNSQRLVCLYHLIQKSSAHINDAGLIRKSDQTLTTSQVHVLKARTAALFTTHRKWLFVLTSFTKENVRPESTVTFHTT